MLNFMGENINSRQTVQNKIPDITVPVMFCVCEKSQKSTEKKQLTVSNLMLFQGKLDLQ